MSSRTLPKYVKRICEIRPNKTFFPPPLAFFEKNGYTNRESKFLRGGNPISNHPEGSFKMSKLHTLLKKRGLTVTCAESCTGGLIAKLLTDPAGASAVFRGSFVTYCDEMKTAMLGVKPETLGRFGAVSPETAREMAAGALSRAGADVALSATGVAGPGTSEGKPVGTVCVAVALRPEALGSGKAPDTVPVCVWVKTYRFDGTRAMNRQFAARAALQLAQTALESPEALGDPLPADG